MSPQHFLLIATLAGAATLPAQDPARTASPPVLDVLRKLESQTSKPNEVTVVLPTPDAAKPPAAKHPAPQAKPPPPAVKPPPSANAPAGIELLATAPATGPANAVRPAPARQGLVVRVEPVRPAQGPIDPAQVTLSAPFPAKPLGAAPAGWELKRLPDVPAVTREVELSPGHMVTLSIRPDVLVPIANGTDVFSIVEPGYDPALGYRQSGTVGNILAGSMRRLDDDAKALGAAIDQLQQALVSLPKPSAPPPATQPATASPDAPAAQPPTPPPATP